MDASPPPPKPNRLHRTASETTRLHGELWAPPGQSSELVVRFEATEFHVWRGIGDVVSSVQQLRPPRCIFGETSMLLSTSGLDYLLRPDDCRRLIRDMAKRVLGKELNNDLFEFKDWDKTVPQDVEARVAELVGARRRGGCTCEVHVDVRVRVRLMYSEAGALLLACILAGRREDGSGAGHIGDGDVTPQCAICFEEMAEEEAEAEAMRLPGCAHAFHCRCIGKWFEKASTCLMCRRHKIQFLPPFSACSFGWWLVGWC